MEEIWSLNSENGPYCRPAPGAHLWGAQASDSLAFSILLLPPGSGVTSLLEPTVGLPKVEGSKISAHGAPLLMEVQVGNLPGRLPASR